MLTRDEAAAGVRLQKEKWLLEGGKIALTDQPYVQAYWHRADRLLSSLSEPRSAESDFILPLSDGAELHIVYVPGKKINASAASQEGLAVVGIMDGVLRATFEMAAALWTNPAVCSSTGDIEQLEPLLAGAPVPRGLEYVASQVTAAGLRATSSPPGWINGMLSRLCPVRRAAFEQTIFTAIDFLLLHEIGHVLGGHHALIRRTEGVQAMEELGDTEIISFGAADSSDPDTVLRALEIEADAYALTQIFSRLPKNLGTPMMTDLRLATALGAIIPHLVLFAFAQLARRQDLARKHPPMWFRAREVLRAERHFRPDWADEASIGPAQWDLTLAAAFNTVGNTHPMFGEWLVPLTDSGRDAPAKSVLAEAETALRPFSPNLATARRRLLMAQ